MERRRNKKRKAQVIIEKLTFSPTCCANYGRMKELFQKMNTTKTSAQTPLVDDYCCISKQLKYQITLDSKENVYPKHIAQYYSVSDNYSSTTKRVRRSSLL